MESFFFQILNVSTYKISHFGDREKQFQQVVLDYKIKYNMKHAWYAFIVVVIISVI